MIIKNITIENFRSYYGVKSMDIGDGLTLIIGANGDGKTTFFEALEWLFDTTVEKYDEKCISKKKAAELEPQESANVRVSMTYINDGSERTVMKSFKFTKNLNGDISVSNYCHDLYIQNGVEKEIKEGYQACRIFDRDFSESIRKYCLFKGEHWILRGCAMVYGNDEPSVSILIFAKGDVGVCGGNGFCTYNFGKAFLI